MEVKREDPAVSETNELDWLRRLGEHVRGENDEEWIGDDPLQFAVRRSRRGRNRRTMNRSSRRRRYTRRQM